MPTSSPTEITSSVVLRGHRDAVTLVAWSPDGSLLASASGGSASKDPTIRLWKSDGTPVAVLRGHTCGVIKMAWSPDSSRIASGSCDGTARIWGSRDGKLIRTIEPHAGTVMAVAWSPDGKLLATGSVESPTQNTVDVWNPIAPEGEALFTQQTQFSGGKFYNLGWSPDGQYLVGGATDYSEWRWPDRTPVFEHPGTAHGTPAWGFAWSPDSRMWGIGNESGDVVVYGTDGTADAHMSNPGGNVDVMAWSPDGTLLAGGNTLWRLENGEAVGQGSLGGGRVASLAWSPTSRVIAVTFAEDMEIELRRTDGVLLARLVGHTGPVSSTAWFPDGSILASASDDGTIRLWDLGSWVASLP